MQKLTLQLPFTELPPKYTCDGENISPPIRISGLIPEVQSLALMAYHPHETSCCSFCAWIIWNIPPIGIIGEGVPRGDKVSTPVLGMQGVNDYGMVGYSGPCPPPGGMHRVNYKVYGLDKNLDLSGMVTKHDLVKAMRGHVLQFGETFAMYQK